MRNGQHHYAERVELQDKIVVAVTSESGADGPGREYEFEVVAIVEDPSSAAHYAICYGEALDQYLVTDEAGRVMEDYALAQAILDDFERDAHPRREGGS